MKNNTKKILSAALAALAVLNSGVLSVNAAQTNTGYDIVSVESGETSDYGYIPTKYVDENGNELTFEEPEELALNCYSLNESDCLPTSFDARENGWITPAKDQASTNNCWVFSTIGALESDSIANGITEKESTDFSEAHLSWFASRTVTDNTDDSAYGDGTNIAAPYLQGGNWRIATAALARRSGLANESDFPFYADNISAMGNYSEADRYNTGSGVILESVQELTDTNEIKEWIAEHGSISAAFCYSCGMYDSANSAYYCNLEKTSNHQITVIGWDDSYPAENFSKSGIPESDGAWLCQNSWGAAWGDNGCFWISYCDKSVTDFYGFTARSTNGNYKNYSYNGADYNVLFGGDSGLRAANIFECEGYEELSSVSFYTVAPETFVRINIYKNLPENYTKPTQGTLAATIEQTLDNGGFHTLYTDTPVILNPGEKFAVSVQYCHPDGKVQIPMEYKTSSKTYYANSKETYLSNNFTADAWSDSANYGSQNAYIQVMTEPIDCDHPQTESIITVEATCTAEGTISDICTQCGSVRGTACISRTQHTYGEWSEYDHDNENNKEVSHRECTVCGTTQLRSYNNGNTVSLGEFLVMFFGKLFEIFKNF